MAIAAAHAVSPFSSVRSARPAFSASALPAASQPERQGLPFASADLLRVYFGNTSGAQRARQTELIEKAVDWYDENVRQIPPLMRGGSRKNHGLHLRMIGDVVGLLPPVNSARAAYWTYMDTFNALEIKVADGKYRMYCHDSEKKTAAPGKYLLRHYGFHILVFGPNGAIETFRRKVPPEANMNGRPGENRDARMEYFDKTSVDYARLEKLLTEKGSAQTGIPGFLSSDHYTHRLLLPGKDGKDAWNQPARPNKTTGTRKNAFETSLAGKESA